MNRVQCWLDSLNTSERLTLLLSYWLIMGLGLFLLIALLQSCITINVTAPGLQVPDAQSTPENQQRSM